MNKRISQLTLKNKKTHIYHDITMLGHYLAGVWEGDGNTNIKDKSSPKTTMHITMDKRQARYANKLLALLRRLCNNDPVGSVHIRHDNNSCVLNIFTPRGLMFVVGLMRDKLRTPKAYHLNDVINWLNTHHGANLDYVACKAVCDLDTPWFAGFVDADGSFGIDLSLKTRLKVSCQFQINQRMYDSKAGSHGNYGAIFSAIALALSVNLYSIMEKKSGRYYYVIKATSRKSKQILRRYFDTYPLLTSKYLDYKDWCAVDDLLENKNHRKHLNQIQVFKGSMNNSRQRLTWYHLRYL